MITLFFAGRTIGHGWLLLVAVFLFACGAKQPTQATDPLTLLKEGRYPEARVAAVNAGLDNDTNRAIAALTYVTESPVASSAKLAVNTLNKDAGNVRTAAVVTLMLGLTSALPPPVSPDVSMAIAESALGAVSYGPYAPGTKPTLTVGAASRELAGLVLARVGFALANAEFQVGRQRLLQIWNSCYSLDGGDFEADGAYRAWRLFKSISTIAIFMGRVDPTDDFTNALFNAAITVVEANPEITIAAKCDLGSPYDDLKKALALKRDLLGRLETALSGATGCSRGTFAPTAP